jgi:MAP3K TRAFs-binding domain
MVLEQARGRVVDDAEIDALLGRAYKDQWREQTTLGDVRSAEENLHRAAETYAEGFRKDPSHYYSGLNAVKLFHILGDDRSLSLRDELLPKVQSAVESEAAVLGEDDHWLTASRLEERRQFSGSLETVFHNQFPEDGEYSSQ